MHLLVELIRSHQDDIVTCWRTKMRELPAARKLDEPTLLDHIPEVLTLIAEMTERLATTPPHRREISERQAAEEHAAELHAIERLEQEFELSALVVELGILRSCILQQLEAAPGPIRLHELGLLDEAIDRAAAIELDRYAAARERTLQTLDQAATAALDSRSLDDLVNHLLEILVRACGAVDTALILVRDGDLLRVRASIGIDPNNAHVSVRIGEDFAGQIAARREPLELRDAAHDPLVQPEALHAAGVKALYGVPFIEAGEVIAVAYMGSFSATEFSRDDKRLFRALASRATAAVFQHVQHEALERTAAELRAREQEFRTLADNIPQFAWMTDPQGQAYWFNQRWLDYTGMTLEEMCRTRKSRFHHPDHLERVTQAFRQALATGQAWEDTFPLGGKTGRYRWFLSRATPIRDASGTIVRWFGTNTDITDQRFLDDATQVLSSSLNYHDTLQQVARLAVPDLADWCVVDLLDHDRGLRRLAIAHANPAQVELAHEYARKYPPVWDAPTGVPAVIRSGKPELAAEITDQALIDLARDEEQLRALRDLGLRSCIIAPLVARGRTLGAITLLTADSQRTYASADLRLAIELGRRAGIAIDNARLYYESQQALLEREDALRSRDEVLAIVSHDLRNPLGAIGMSASLLLDQIAPELRPKVELIQRSADRMEHMIGDLLDMAAIQARGVTLERMAEDADRIVSSVIEWHEAKATSRGIRLVREGELRAQLWCDRECVERVFENLLGNAIKYCRPGDVISVRAHVFEEHAMFCIADTGPGIPPDEVPHLFEPYWTVKRKGAKKGTGLGLYISKSIVEAHRGQLWVKSEPSQGTEFCFTLPLADGARTQWRGDDQPSQIA